MGLRDYTRIYLTGEAISAAYRGTAQIFGGAPDAPGSFTLSSWGVAPGEAPGTVVLTITALPASPGAAISGLLCSVDGGAAFALDAYPGRHVIGDLPPGATVGLRIAALNAIGQSPWSAEKPVIVTAEPVAPPQVLSTPEISGTAQIGLSLHGSEGSWTGAPAIALQWLRDGLPIVGATGADYLLTESDLYAMIALRATATNAGGSTTATSAALGPVLAPGTAPQNLAAPAILGTAAPGATLTAQAGDWSGTPEIALQWLRNGTAISGATGQTLTLTADDLGAAIALRVIATNASGSTEATSHAVTVTAAEAGLAATGGAGAIIITRFGAPAAPDITSGPDRITITAYGA